MTDQHEGMEQGGRQGGASGPRSVLLPNERRVLGALIEKSLAQPAYYPMTLNALVAACNQKQNREPVMHLEEPQVYDAIEALKKYGAASEILPSGTSRTKRYRQLTSECYGWQKRERAVMAELLLRGPQTVGELRTRCSRMVPFDDLEAVTTVLECLERNYSPPFIVAMPRVPGQSAVRYCHTLYPKREQERLAVAETHSTPGLGEPAAPHGTVAASSSLEAEFRELREAVEELRGRVEALESAQGQP
jgi:hypothetical protein